MKLIDLFRPWRWKILHRQPIYWVRRTTHAGRAVFALMQDDGFASDTAAGAEKLADFTYFHRADRLAVELNAQHLRLSLSESQLLTSKLTCFREGELKALSELQASYVLQPPPEGRGIQQMTPEEAAAARPGYQVPTDDPYGGHVKLIPWDGPPPGYQAMPSPLQDKKKVEPTAELLNDLLLAVTERYAGELFSPLKAHHIVSDAEYKLEALGFSNHTVLIDRSGLMMVSVTVTADGRETVTTVSGQIL